MTEDINRSARLADKPSPRGAPSRQELADNLGEGLDGQLASLRQLPENWNGYGEKRITDQALAVCSALHFSPVHDGGVQIELHHSGVDVEIMIGPEGEVSSVFWGPSYYSGGSADAGSPVRPGGGDEQ